MVRTLTGTAIAAVAISVGAFVAFGLYLGMLTWPLIALGWVVNLFQRGAASGARSKTTLWILPVKANGDFASYEGETGSPLSFQHG